MTTRQYARLVSDWIASIGLDPTLFGTHSLRRTKATLIYRRTGNLRAVQLLLGHSELNRPCAILASRSMTLLRLLSRSISEGEPGEARRSVAGCPVLLASRLLPTPPFLLPVTRYGLRVCIAARRVALIDHLVGAPSAPPARGPTWVVHQVKAWQMYRYPAGVKILQRRYAE
jgi:hypothetical protein